METMDKLRERIEEQRKGHEAAPRWMIGEQLLDIAGREPLSAELLLRDLEIKEMNLEAAEKKFAEYAGKNRGKESVFCITPKVAEKLLREFYGLAEPEAPSEKKDAPTDADGDYIDLSAFL